MSNKKYTNVEITEIYSRLMHALGISKKIELAKLLNISTQTLKNREDRGINGVDDIKLLCNKKRINEEWVFTGQGEMEVNFYCKTADGSEAVKEIKADYEADKTIRDIIYVLHSLNQEAKQDVLKYAEEKKLLAELKAEKQRKVA